MSGVPKAFYSFMGLAVGDAVGTTQEFERVTIPGKQTDMEGRGVFNLKKGDWTDDTSMALCVALSIIKTRTINLENQMGHFKDWAELGYYSSNGTCFDIGNTVRNAITQFTPGKQVREPNVSYAGNGCLMKLAPIPMFLHMYPDLAIQYSGYSAMNIHNTTSAIDCCRYLASLIVGAIHGATKEELTTPFYVPPPLPADYWEQYPLCEDVKNMIANYQFAELKPHGLALDMDNENATHFVFNSGYSVKCLEAVLWHLRNSNSFKEGVLAISNHGYDSDTVAAVYGQVAGPLYSTSFPMDWMDALTLGPFLQYISIIISLMADNVVPMGTEEEGQRYKYKWERGVTRAPPTANLTPNSPTLCTEQRAIWELVVFRVQDFPKTIESNIGILLYVYMAFISKKYDPVYIDKSNFMKNMYDTVTSWKNFHDYSGEILIVCHCSLTQKNVTTLKDVDSEGNAKPINDNNTFLFTNIFYIDSNCDDNEEYQQFNSWTNFNKYNLSYIYNLNCTNHEVSVEVLQTLINMVVSGVKHLKPDGLIIIPVPNTVNRETVIQFYEKVISEYHLPLIMNKNYEPRFVLNDAGGNNTTYLSLQKIENQLQPIDYLKVVDTFFIFVQDLLSSIIQCNSSYQTLTFFKLKNSHYFFKLQCTSKYLSRPFHPELFIKSVTLLNEFEETKTKCNDYYLHRIKTELQDYLHFSWFELINKYNLDITSRCLKNVEDMRNEMSYIFPLLVSPTFDPYQQLIFNWSNEYIITLLQTISPEKLLRFLIQPNEGVIYIHNDFQPLYQSKSFVKTPACDANLGKGYFLSAVCNENIDSAAHNTPQLLLPAYWKPYIKTKHDKCWFLLHLQYQMLSTQRTYLCKDCVILDESETVQGPTISPIESVPVQGPTISPMESVSNEVKLIVDKIRLNSTKIGDNGRPLPAKQEFNSSQKVMLFRSKNVDTPPQVILHTLQKFYTISDIPPSIAIFEQIERIPVQPYQIRKKNGEVSVIELPVTQYDVIIVYTSPQSSDNIDFESLKKFLKDNGKLVLVFDKDKPLNSTGYTYMNTTQRFLQEEYCYFNTKFAFYMKKLDTGFCFYSSALATFPYPKPTEFNVNIAPSKRVTNVFAITQSDAGPLIVKYLNDIENTSESKLLCLPMNYIHTNSRGAAEELLHIINSDWDKISEILRSFDLSNERLKKLNRLHLEIDLFFRSTIVRGGGNCMFLAINELLALKSLPLITLESLFAKVIEFVNLLNFNFMYAPDFPDNKQQAVQNFINDYMQLNNRDAMWCFVIAYMYNIEIVLFNISPDQHEHNVIDYKPIGSFTAGSDANFVEAKNGKFFIARNARTHYYPLFPIYTYPATVSLLVEGKALREHL